MSNEAKQWLEDAVFYEIYPQSFYDSNGDGIGDIPGISVKLDYIRDLGCNALWINPCFDSPFKDAGYDIRDYTKVASRYGTNEDLINLFGQAHEKGMHVLLDLVPGHTSEEHPWFKASSEAARGSFSDRYIWTRSAFEAPQGQPFIAGESERDGAYVLNFFKCQPALNYGYAHPDKPWQWMAGSEPARRTEEAMSEVIRYWLSRGCDGFRVDMADSLVKFDGDDKTYTIEAWKRIFAPIKKDFPAAAFVSEWGRPWLSFKAGFDMDFYLDWRWDKPNGYNRLLRDTDSTLVRESDLSYFNADSPSSPIAFLRDYLPQYTGGRQVNKNGSFSFITCNHDTPRIAPRLRPEEIKLAYAMIFTMPGVPFLYYGDELGLHYRNLPTKEGGYGRTGSRTPMQWTSYDPRTNPTCGFSQADPQDLYLPVDEQDDGISAAAERDDPDSLLNFVRKLLALRHRYPALRSTSDWEVINAESGLRSLTYLRKDPEGQDDISVCINPGRKAETVTFEFPRPRRHKLLLSIGGEPEVESRPEERTDGYGRRLSIFRVTFPPQSVCIHLV